MTVNSSPPAVLDDAVNRTVQELVVTAGFERSVRRMAEVTLNVAELTKRIEEAGFGQVASAVRKAAEGMMVGLLAPPVAGSDARPVPSVPPRIGRKRQTGE